MSKSICDYYVAKFIFHPLRKYFWHGLNLDCTENLQTQQFYMQQSNATPRPSTPSSGCLPQFSFKEEVKISFIVFFFCCSFRQIAYYRDKSIGRLIQKICCHWWNKTWNIPKNILSKKNGSYFVWLGWQNVLIRTRHVLLFYPAAFNHITWSSSADIVQENNHINIKFYSATFACLVPQYLISCTGVNHTKQMTK